MSATPAPILAGTDESGTLRIVRNVDAPPDHLRVAARHLEAAIAHVNDAAQSRMPLSPGEDTAVVDELRLIVRALADIHEALREHSA